MLYGQLMVTQQTLYTRNVVTEVLQKGRGVTHTVHRNLSVSFSCGTDKILKEGCYFCLSVTKTYCKKKRNLLQVLESTQQELD